ncbi:MAG: LysM peptidoglycan-binding domain-containing protein [Gemmatimonadota bacterium]
MKGRAVIGIAAALLVAGGVAGAREEERPRIFLEKRIFAETSAGKKAFYEVHAVEEGESLWKIFGRRGPLPPEDYAALLKEFRRANPGVSDPDKLRPGQRILVPSAPSRLADPRIAAGKAVAYRVEKGDSLTAILAERGVSRAAVAGYLEAVKALNESVRDVDLIYAGRTLLIPTDKFFAAAAALTKDVPPSSAAEELPTAKTEGQIEPPKGPGLPAGGASGPPRAGEGAGSGGSASAFRAEGQLPPQKPAYRGLLSDLLRGLGEKWLDRGMLYLPVPAGGEVVLSLEEYPVARFATGIQELIDFAGSLPSDVRALVEETWRNDRVVSMAGAQGPEEMIDRVLRSSGYHSVKEGLARPLVIGEDVSVAIPARWIVLRTEQSLLAGEVILVKQVPEQPGEALSAVLRYADRVGIRVLPYAVDPSAREGFLVAVEDRTGDSGTPARPVLPKRGLEALDFSLAFLGISPIEEKRLTMGGTGGAYRLTIEPERMFAAGGKRYVVDAGRMTPAVRAIVRDSGYVVFPVGGDEPGTSVFRRVLDAAGLAAEARRNVLVAGGENDGFEIRATGLFLTSAPWLESRGLRAAVVVRGRVHPETWELLKGFGVEIVGPSS